MLARIGVESCEELFEAVPTSMRFPAVDLPAPLSEMEVLAELRALAARNDSVTDRPCFLGAGAYNHFVPSVVNHLTGRSEFYTAYTPYQPEISQGTLQAIFEYQTMICELTGMDVSNASHYDGATALAEARHHGGQRLARQAPQRRVVSPTVHPEYRADGAHLHAGHGPRRSSATRRPTTDIDEPGRRMVDDDTACLIVQTPDFLGRILDLTRPG